MVDLPQLARAGLYMRNSPAAHCEPDSSCEAKHQRLTSGLHGDQAQHHHCERCKSWLFTRVAPDVGFVNVRPSVLDDHSWFEPYIETQTAEKLPWAGTPARHSFERFPPMDAYATLVAEYQRTAPTAS